MPAGDPAGYLPRVKASRRSRRLRPKAPSSRLGADALSGARARQMGSLASQSEAQRAAAKTGGALAPSAPNPLARKQRKLSAALLRNKNAGLKSERRYFNRKRAA